MPSDKYNEELGWLVVIEVVVYWCSAGLPVKDKVLNTFSWLSTPKFISWLYHDQLFLLSVLKSLEDILVKIDDSLVSNI